MNTLGIFRYEEMCFLWQTMLQLPVWLEHLKLFPIHHGIVVVNVGLEPGVVNVNPGTGRWGQTMFGREEQLPKEKWR